MDWEKIKQEYITSNLSYRKLADKYEAPLSSLMARGSREGWVELREQFKSETIAKTIARGSDAKSKRAVSVTSAADRLLDEVVKLIDGFTTSGKTMSETTIKKLAGALKDIKAVKDGKTPLDIEEQKVRIAILKKQAADEDHDKDIIVSFEGGIDEYGK